MKDINTDIFTIIYPLSLGKQKIKKNSLQGKKKKIFKGQSMLFPWIFERTILQEFNRNFKEYFSGTVKTLNEDFLK